MIDSPEAIMHGQSLGKLCPNFYVGRLDELDVRQSADAAKGIGWEGLYRSDLARFVVAVR